MPLFIKENTNYLRLAARNKAEGKKPAALERAKARHAQRTPQQIQEIKQRWEERKKQLETRKFELWNDEKLKQEIANTKITTEELRLIDGSKGGCYTKTSESFDINAALRTATPQTLSPRKLEAVEALDKIIARNILKEDMMCYRYDNINLARYLSGRENIKQEEFLSLFQGLQGQVLEDKGFRSVSSVEGRNAFKHYPIRLNIRVKAGTPAYVADNFHESELVLGRGSKIKILSVKQTDSKTIVECELL